MKRFRRWFRKPRRVERKPRPEVGGVEFLVYGDCRCGWRMAAPEGWHWPKCPECGEQVLPPKPNEQIRLGYVAILLPESTALEVGSNAKTTGLL